MPRSVGAAAEALLAAMVAVEKIVALRAATADALTPLARASPANCFFHASKPAAVCRTVRALALLAMHTNATTATTLAVLNRSA